MWCRALACLTFFLGIFFVLPAFGTPIHPDIKKLIKEAQQPPVQYQPARAGWNGPESTPPNEINPAYESILAMDSPAGVRNQMLDLATPYWPTWLAFGLIILLLRLLRADQKNRRQVGVPIPFPARPSNRVSDDQASAA